MDSLCAEGTPTAVKFLVAFAVVFALIAVTAWLIRRFGTGALGGTGTRGRAPRLAVIEAGAVDGRRKLVLIRRDNTEHLLMIGGPTDIVVEANIVRGQSARDSATSRPSPAADALPRTLPAEETAWPLQPEATPRNGRAARPAPLEDVTQWALPPEPAPPAAPPKRSRSAETLAGLAAELSVRPAEPATPPPPPRTAAPAPEAPRAKPAPAAPAPAPASADQNLADMASRLEAALRRPSPAPTPRPAAPAPKPAAEAPRVAPPIVPPAPQAAPPIAPQVAPPVAPPVPPIVAKEPAPAPVSAAPAVTIEPEKKKPADGKPAKADDVFGSIEEEMANLLGRPTGKPS